MNKKLTIAILFILIIGFLIGLRYGCLFRNIWGINCPSCGLSRAWLSFLKGDFSQAASYHPMFFFPPLALLYCCRTKAIINYRLELSVIVSLCILYFVIYFIKLFI